MPPERNLTNPQGCTESFVYRQDGAPLELLSTPAKDTITQRYWYVLDGRGDVVALTDSSGKVVDRYHHDLWGAPTIDREDVPQPLLYAGYVYDRELVGPNESSGWYWLSVRHYDPSGRTREARPLRTFKGSATHRRQHSPVARSRPMADTSSMSAQRAISPSRTPVPRAEVVPGVGPVTANALMALPDDGRRYEVVEGVLVRVAGSGDLRQPFSNIFHV